MTHDVQIQHHPYQRQAPKLRTKMLTSVNYTEAHYRNFPDLFPNAYNPVEVMCRVKNVSFTPECISFMEKTLQRRQDITVWTQRITEDSLGYEISRYMPRDKRIQYKEVGELILKYDPAKNHYILQDILHNGVSLRCITCAASATFFLGR